MLCGLREQEIIYIKDKEICNNGYGCDCNNMHKVDCRTGLTIIAIGWTRGNKKALATIIPTLYWEKFRALQKFDYTDIATTHKIMKRDVGIAYIAMRKIHFNVMRFRDTLSVDEAELAGRFSSVSGRHYVLHDGSVRLRYIHLSVVQFINEIILKCCVIIYGNKELYPVIYMK